LIDSQLDYQKFEIDADGKATISIIAHSGFYTLGAQFGGSVDTRKPKAHLSDRHGLDMLYSLQNQDLQWTPT
jgi:hypothetical protein